MTNDENLASNFPGLPEIIDGPGQSESARTKAKEIRQLVAKKIKVPSDKIAWLSIYDFTTKRYSRSKKISASFSFDQEEHQEGDSPGESTSDTVALASIQTEGQSKAIAELVNAMKVLTEGFKEHNSDKNLEVMKAFYNELVGKAYTLVDKLNTANDNLQAQLFKSQEANLNLQKVVGNQLQELDIISGERLKKFKQLMKDLKELNDGKPKEEKRWSETITTIVKDLEPLLEDAKPLALMLAQRFMPGLLPASDS